MELCFFPTKTIRFPLNQVLYDEIVPLHYKKDFWSSTFTELFAAYTPPHLAGVTASSYDDKCLY